MGKRAQLAEWKARDGPTSRLSLYLGIFSQIKIMLKSQMSQIGFSQEHNKTYFLTHHILVRMRALSSIFLHSVNLVYVIRSDSFL